MSGQIFTLVGWGQSGVVSSGDYDYGMETMHAAENRVDKIQDNMLVYTMQKPGDKGQALEGIGGSGDSGGPALIRGKEICEKDGKCQKPWYIGGVKSNGAGGPNWDSTNEYTRLGGIAYEWLMKNISFDTTTKKPVPWVKLTEEDCKKFKPTWENPDQQYGDEGDTEAPWNQPDNDWWDDPENGQGEEENQWENDDADQWEDEWWNDQCVSECECDFENEASDSPCNQKCEECWDNVDFSTLDNGAAPGADD